MTTRTGEELRKSRNPRGEKKHGTLKSTAMVGNYFSRQYD